MRNRIERFRLWLGRSMSAARRSGRIHRLRPLSEAPRPGPARSRLGIDINSETNGFTYSQSLQGRTIYTIHAAKEIEHQRQDHPP